MSFFSCADNERYNDALHANWLPQEDRNMTTTRRRLEREVLSYFHQRIKTSVLFYAFTLLVLMAGGIDRSALASSDDSNVSGSDKGCSYILHYENDQLLTDRNYTFGGVLTYSCDSEKDRPWLSFLRNWNKIVLEDTKYLFGIFNATKYAYAHYGGISLYTPDSLKIKQPRRADGRPYASLLIYGDSVLHANSTMSIKQEMQVGILGHPIGGIIQSTVHDVFGGDDPQGWPTEISRGGEPIFGYSVQGTRRLCSVPSSSEFCGKDGFDLTANFGGSLGYYTSLKAGLSGRLGSINSPFWEEVGPISSNILQPQTSLNFPNVSSTSNCQKGSDDELFFFATGGADVVMYSAVLQGQFRRSEYVVSASGVSRIVPYASVGVVVRFGRYRFSVSHNARGPELKGGKSHRWTSFSVGTFF